jgi:hypothetical protein
MTENKTRPPTTLPAISPMRVRLWDGNAVCTGREDVDCIWPDREDVELDGAAEVIGNAVTVVVVAEFNTAEASDGWGSGTVLIVVKNPSGEVNPGKVVPLATRDVCILVSGDGPQRLRDWGSPGFRYPISIRVVRWDI